MELDSMNRRILALLEKNARQSATEIGRIVGLSRTAVQDRIRKLEQKNVIQSYRVVLADPRYEPLKALVFVKIAGRPCDPALNWMKKIEGVQEVLSLSGSWDAIVRISVGSTEELADLNDCIESSDLIENCVSQIILKSL